MEREKGAGRIEATYRASIEALLEIMEEAPFLEITVEQIASKAGISRVTFYKYFVDKNDLLWKAFEHVYLEVSDQVQRIDPATLLSDGRPVTYYVFENVRRHRSFYENLFLNGMPYEFQCRFTDYLTKESYRTHAALRALYNGTVPYICINQYLAGALMNLIRNLLLDKEDWDSMEMAEFFTALAAPGLLALCSPAKQKDSESATR